MLLREYIVSLIKLINNYIKMASIKSNKKRQPIKPPKDCKEKREVFKSIEKVKVNNPDGEYFLRLKYDKKGKVEMHKKYKCLKRYPLKFNKDREYEMLKLAEARRHHFNKCVKGTLDKNNKVITHMDIGHRKVVRFYEERAEKCGQIVLEQEKEKKKIKKVSDLTVKQLKEILDKGNIKYNKYKDRKKDLVKKVEKNKLIKDFDELNKKFSKLKL